MDSGVWAEFEHARFAEDALEALRHAGYRRLEAYSPYPHGPFQPLTDASPSPIPWFVFVAALIGAATAYAILYFSQVVDYPLNIGGRPQHAAISYLPLVFETMVLFGAVTAFLSFLRLGGMPKPLQNVMRCQGAERLLQDRFAVAVSEEDSIFDEARVVEVLRDCGPVRICRFGGQP